MKPSSYKWTKSKAPTKLLQRNSSIGLRSKKIRW